MPRLLLILLIFGALAMTMTQVDTAQAKGLEFKILKLADGTTLEYGLVLPEGFDPAKTYPTLLALPPGGQSRQMVTEGLERWLGYMQKEGWVVASPVAPGRLFFSGSEKYLPELMDHLAAEHSLEGGKFYLFGISNGGISAFRAATVYPERFHSMTVLPGFPQPEDSRRLSTIKDLPVSIIVGDRDGGWVDRARETTRELEALGGNVALEVVAGADHFVMRRVEAEELFGFITRR